MTMRKGKVGKVGSARRSERGSIGHGSRASRDVALRTVLLLDAGDVLLVDPLRQLFDDLAERSPLPRNEIVTEYRNHLRVGLWNGTMSEDSFWHELGTKAHLDLPAKQYRQAIQTWMKPLPAALQLSRLASRYPARRRVKSPRWMVETEAQGARPRPYVRLAIHF